MNLTMQGVDFRSARQVQMPRNLFGQFSALDFERARNIAKLGEQSREAVAVRGLVVRAFSAVNPRIVEFGGRFGRRRRRIEALFHDLKSVLHNRSVLLREFGITLLKLLTQIEAILTGHPT